VAKGNNGNLLQHFIECEVAARLTQSAPERGLHIVLTHGMAPYEPFERTRRTPHVGLDVCLAAAGLDESVDEMGETPLLRAYRQAEASADHYPNSGELMAAVAGSREALAGMICETEPCKQEELSGRWRGTSVRIHKGSWREADLSAPEALDSPWLFSMDPFTFSEKDDSGDLHKGDLAIIADLLVGYRDSSQHGALCVFCYGLRPKSREAYIEAVSGVFGGSDVQLRFAETCAGGGNSHVGALVSRDVDLVDAIVNAWADLSAELKL